MGCSGSKSAELVKVQDAGPDNSSANIVPIKPEAAVAVSQISTESPRTSEASGNWVNKKMSRMKSLPKLLAEDASVADAHSSPRADEIPQMQAELWTCLKEWKLEDAKGRLVQHGVISLERLQDITLDEVPELGLPFATAKAFRKLVLHFNPAGSEARSEVRIPAAGSKKVTKKRPNKVDAAESCPSSSNASSRTSSSDPSGSESEDEERVSKKMMSRVIQALPPKLSKWVAEREDCPPGLAKLLKQGPLDKKKRRRTTAKKTNSRSSSSDSSDSGSDDSIEDLDLDAIKDKVSDATSVREAIESLPPKLRERMLDDEDCPPEIAKVLKAHRKRENKRRKKAHQKKSHASARPKVIGPTDCKPRDVLCITEERDRAEDAFNQSDAAFNDDMLSYLGQEGRVVEVDDASVMLEHDDGVQLWWAYRALELPSSGSTKRKKKPKSQWEKVFMRYAKFWRRIARMAALPTQPGDVLLKMELDFFRKSTIKTLTEAGWEIEEPIERIVVKGERDLQVKIAAPLLFSSFD